MHSIATNLWFWIGFIAFVLAMLALDLGVFHREAHEVRPREAALWTVLWVTLALLFALVLRLFEPPGTTFVVAATPNGLRDSALVTVVAVP